MRITNEEYRTRMDRLQSKVRDHALDGFLISGKDSIFYLTGVSYEPLERPFFILVRPDSPVVLLVPALEKTHLQAAPNVTTVQQYWDYPSPPGQGWPEKLLGLVKGVSALGVEPSLPQEIALALQSLPLQTLPLVEELRLVKSPAEVEMIRLAAHYADLAVAKVIGASYYGVAEIELFSQGRNVQIQIMKDVGYDALTTSVLVGAWPAPLSAQPHGVPSIGDRLKEGPHIALCLDRVFGYAAECERTYFTAPPTQVMKDAFAAMSEARRRAYGLIRPGVPCAEIDAAANGFLRDEGYGDYLLHRTGHGFGLGNHEGPWVAEGSEETLQANMVISNEPGIYLPEVGGIRHSDTILVTETGYENLTCYPVELDSLVVQSRKSLTRLRGAFVRRAVGVT
ncbi:MAG: aminopeptidase P family protein [Chloroflexi bacterium]|nr:aminopeptidase P family protein [Chloroflexota bacterium]